MVAVSKELTYIGAFLTFHCGYRCSYCLNRYGSLTHCKELSAAEWIEGFNRLGIEREWMVPVTLQGGEPSLHDGFTEIINGLRGDLYIDLLTNLDFDVDNFMKHISPERLKRNVSYASIRVSYHPEFVDANSLLAKILNMHLKGYSIGLFAIEHPQLNTYLVSELCKHLKIDFRSKDFLGEYEGKTYGLYKYPEAIRGHGGLKHVFCKMTELLIAPNGSIHRCHRDLYTGENSLGNLMDDDLKIEFKFRKCENFGSCNPCDVKLKNNRFQQWGSCSAEIMYDGGIIKPGFYEGKGLPCLLSK